MSPPRLITIPISHFCEKARWALERGGIDYVEEPHLQIFHHYYALRAGGGLTTPVLRFDDGHVLGQSSEILEWVDSQLEPDARLYPEAIAPRVRAVEHWLDVTLGPDGRAWMYGHVLKQPELVEQFGLEGTPQFERALFTRLLNGFKPYLATRVRIQGTNPDIQAVLDVYDDIAGRLEDGRPFIFGDRFTAADLAFAALSASVLVPEQYGVRLPPVELLAPAMREQVEAMRAHPAGQFALRLFATERHHVVAAPAAIA